MDKGIGFNRQLKRSWLDAAAAFSAGTQDPAGLRDLLEPVVAQDLSGIDARRKTIDLLVNIWLHTREIAPRLWEMAVEWNQSTTAPDDRLWLHYGLALLYYSFFRACVATIGQISRYGETVTTRLLCKKMAVDMGQLGSLERAVQRVVSSLRDWEVLETAGRRFTYRPPAQALSASHSDLEAWLLACALYAHPAEELPFADLLRLPELFPFQFTLTLSHLQDHPWFAVQRQGDGWNMVRLTLETGKNLSPSI